jgi:GAF domain-containing protein
VTSELTRLLADAARELEGEGGDPRGTMERAVHLGVQLVRGAHEAGITVARRGGRIETPAATAELVVRVEMLQQEHQEGPCLDALRKQEVVRSADIGRDDRWPVWGPRVAGGTPIRSMLCLRLFTHDDVVGGLNLYSYDVDAFDDEDVEDGVTLAAQAAVAIAAAQEIAQLKFAVDGRTVIGQAQGILMERFGIDPTQAFAVLARVSQAGNVKIREVAEQLVLTRTLPG